jgi:membrane dipeptidase
MVQLVGPDHVGISLDYVFDQADLIHELETKRHTFPDPQAYSGVPQMAPPEALVDVVAALMQRGYRDLDLEKILGANWRRVAQQVWRA